MLFNSYQFVFVFLPLLLIGYQLLARCGARSAVPMFLVLGSLFFYGWWDWHYLFLFGFSIAFNYSWAQALRPRSAAGADRRFAPRAMLAAGVAVNLGLLGYFKYRNFFVSSAAAVVGRHWEMPPVVLPLAISFFTFEQLTYLTSAWRGEIETRDFLSYTLFITFFPHLIAGPIVRYGEIFPQLNRNSELPAQGRQPLRGPDDLRDRAVQEGDDRGHLQALARSDL